MCIPETSALYIHSGCIFHARTLPRSTSPVSGCSDGSISTFWVTSPSSEVVTSLISLCHLITWSTPFALPQAQRLGIPVGHHPYLKARASRKAPLFRVKPFSSTGRVLNHEDDPFCSAKDRAFFCSQSLLCACLLLFSGAFPCCHSSLLWRVCSILHQCATHPFPLCHKLSSSKVLSLSLSYCIVDQLLPAISQFLALQVVWAGRTSFFLHRLSPVVQ